MATLELPIRNTPGQVLLLMIACGARGNCKRFATPAEAAEASNRSCFSLSLVCWLLLVAVVAAVAVCLLAAGLAGAVLEPF